MFTFRHNKSNSQIIFGELEIIIFEDFVYGRQRLWNMANFIPKHCALAWKCRLHSIYKLRFI